MLTQEMGPETGLRPYFRQILGSQGGGEGAGRSSGMSEWGGGLPQPPDTLTHFIPTKCSAGFNKSSKKDTVGLYIMYIFQLNSNKKTLYFSCLQTVNLQDIATYLSAMSVYRQLKLIFFYKK
jgi:hypothetical protein